MKQLTIKATAKLLHLLKATAFFWVILPLSFLMMGFNAFIQALELIYFVYTDTFLRLFV
jgi:hypothetical protein